MIEFLRRLFGGRGGSARPVGAPLNHSLLLVIGRRKPAEAYVRGSGTFGRWGARVVASICELPGEETEGIPATTSLDELVEGFSDRLDPVARSDLFGFIHATVLEDLEKPGGDALARSLHRLRERLRRRLPSLPAEGLEPAHVDFLTMVDDRSVWVHGWCSGGDEVLAHVELISPEGHVTGTLEGSYRFPRPDVAESLAEKGIPEATDHGYANYLELPAPSRVSTGWLAQLRGPSGSGFQWELPPANDPSSAREMILREVSTLRAGIEELRSGRAYPALRRNHAHLRSSIEVDDIVQQGDPPSAPDVSIIVPLYERIDLVEHQVTQFWQDPDFGTAELIYVLDSPDLAFQLAGVAGEMYALYDLPLKVLNLSRNAGYAGANNLAVPHARGRLLLFLNSDVLPVEPGWLGRMQRFYDATPQIGALGPKLLYEDDSIQHAGMHFHLDTTTGWWENHHYYKGFTRSLPMANVNRPVPAVTGACLMIERKLFGEVGGLSEDYIQGGYEDSDLCLKVIEAGRENWYLAGVELYHLEAQSFPIHLRGTNRYNAWLQTHRWNDRIKEVMESQQQRADVRVVPVA